MAERNWKGLDCRRREVLLLIRTSDVENRLEGGTPTGHFFVLVHTELALKMPRVSPSKAPGPILVSSWPLTFNYSDG